MKISDLNKKVMLQENSMIADGFGGFITTWTNREEIWASVNPHKINNQQKSERLQKTTHKIVIRTRSEISNKFRVIYDGKIYDFESIRFTDPTNRFQEINVIQR